MLLRKRFILEVLDDFGWVVHNKTDVVLVRLLILGDVDPIVVG